MLDSLKRRCERLAADHLVCETVLDTYTFAKVSDYLCQKFIKKNTICDGMRPISLRYCLVLERLMLDFCGSKTLWHCVPRATLHLARAIPRAATWLRTNQRRSCHQAQSDWRLFGGTCIVV